jgi:hypothetical protein
MKPFDMQIRQDAYIEILNWGLLAIRDYAAHHGNAELAELEADHIHNLPSLLNEPNEARHHYYIYQERQYYLDRLMVQTHPQYRDRVLRWYKGPWAALLLIADKEKQDNEARSAAGDETPDSQGI